MRIFIISIVCILLSGCGLFRKTTKVNKQLDAVSVSSDVQVSTETNAGKVDKTKETEKTSSEGEEKVKVYPTPGTEVKVDKDGSMTFKADSIVSYTKHKTNQARQILNDIKEDLSQKIGISAKKDSTDEKKVETKDVDRRPSASGIFSNWIAGGLVVVGILAFLLWYFGIRPKKPKKENKTKSDMLL
jgi:hypothetical protein